MESDADFFLHSNKTWRLHQMFCIEATWHFVSPLTQWQTVDFNQQGRRGLWLHKSCFKLVECDVGSSIHLWPKLSGSFLFFFSFSMAYFVLFCFCWIIVSWKRQETWWGNREGRWWGRQGRPVWDVVGYMLHVSDCCAARMTPRCCL